MNTPNVCPTCKNESPEVCSDGFHATNPTTQPEPSAESRERAESIVRQAGLHSLKAQRDDWEVDAIATAIDEARREAPSWIVCTYCGHKEKKGEGFPRSMAEHVLSCEKSPIVKFWKDAEADLDRLRAENAELRARLEQPTANQL